MRRSIVAVLTSVRQGLRISSVGLDPAGSCRVHEREIRIGNDHLVAELLQAARHPFALRARLDQNLGPRSPAENRGKALALGANALLNDLAVCRHDADLALPLVYVDPDVVHGLPPLRLPRPFFAPAAPARPAASSHLPFPSSPHATRL